MKNYLKNRDRAMDWINSQDHDFARGITILKDAGFKPGVVSVLERHGSGRHESNERLMYHMHDFIRCFANPKAKEDTDITIGVVEGKELQPDSLVNDKIPSMLSDGVKEKLDSGTYPEIIAEVISVYREAFVKRDKLLHKLSELPETNDDDTIMKRREISDAMKTLSDIMDKLYPQYEAYVTGGTVPEVFKAPTIPNPEDIGNETAKAAPRKPAIDDSGDECGSTDDDSSDVTVPNVSKAELQRQRKSIVTKISRAKNMLLYQKETKQEQENPITDPKKVAKYQAKIDRLTQELNDIDMQIAALA